jgi:hypothetical protein
MTTNRQTHGAQTTLEKAKSAQKKAGKKSKRLPERQPLSVPRKRPGVAIPSLVDNMRAASKKKTGAKKAARKR